VKKKNAVKISGKLKGRELPSAGRSKINSTEKAARACLRGKKKKRV